MHPIDDQNDFTGGERNQNDLNVTDYEKVTQVRPPIGLIESSRVYLAN